MGLNFRKSLSIGRLFRINFSKRGVGVSAGVKGARVSVNKDGVRETFSLPGTGLSWSERQSFKKRKKTGVPNDSAGEATNKKKIFGQWKSLLWVAVIAGAFMLYKSGAFDPAIRRFSSALSGKPVTGATSSVKAEEASATYEKAADASAESTHTVKSAAGSADSSAIDGASTSATLPVASSSGDEPMAAGTRVVQCKDVSVTLKAGTLYVASKSGEKFHVPDCSVVASIASKNLTEYASREDADAKKDPCSKCNP